MAAVHPTITTGRAGAPVDDVGTELVRLRRTIETMRTCVLEHGAHGVEGSALGALFHLVREGEQRASSLADRLGLDPSTMSRHVAALVRSGHVERVHDPDDGRATLLRATETGRRAFEDTQDLRTRLLHVALCGWAPEEVEAFAGALARFNDSFDHIDLDALVVHEHTARKAQP